MDIFFLDDSHQNNPSRKGMGPVSSIGGLYVPDESIKLLETTLEKICVDGYGFPPKEIFKWSPDPDTWMHSNLKGNKRESFFIEILSAARKFDCRSIVVIEDTQCGRANKGSSVEIDLIQLFFERAELSLIPNKRESIVIVSQPSGDRKAEYKFLADCVESLKCGTDYVKPNCIALSIMSCTHKILRSLQLADVVCSCTTARVAGEDRFSPQVFDAIKPLFLNDGVRVGGIGLKIHPDMYYTNLYYWLLGDAKWWKGGMGFPLPDKRFYYSSDPYIL